MTEGRKGRNKDGHLLSLVSFPPCPEQRGLFFFAALPLHGEELSVHPIGALLKGSTRLHGLDGA
jgi:hypothetical protein